MALAQLRIRMVASPAIHNRFFKDPPDLERGDDGKTLIAAALIQVQHGLSRKRPHGAQQVPVQRLCVGQLLPSLAQMTARLAQEQRLPLNEPPPGREARCGAAIAWHRRSYCVVDHSRPAYIWFF